MGWDSKRSGKNRPKYYYRARRVGPRIIKEYVGAGKAGAEAAAQDAEKRLQREQAKAEVARVLAGAGQAGEPLDRLCVVVRLMSMAVLLVAGFYVHDRGQWRRRRKHG